MLAKVRKGISSCYNCIYRSHWGVVQCCSKLIFYQQCWHPIWTVVCVQAALTSMQLPANNLGRRQKRALNLGLLYPHGASGSWLQSVTFKQLEEGPPRPLNSENRISKSAVTPRVHSQQKEYSFLSSTSFCKNWSGIPMGYTAWLYNAVCIPSDPEWDVRIVGK